MGGECRKICKIQTLIDITNINSITFKIDHFRFNDQNSPNGNIKVSIETNQHAVISLVFLIYSFDSSSIRDNVRQLCCQVSKFNSSL